MHQGSSTDAQLSPADVDHVGDVRERLLLAATRCLARDGAGRTSISSVAREAQVSRQTVYAYFDGRDVLVAEAIEHAARRASIRIIAEASRQATAADFVVEMVALAAEEFTANPAIAPMVDEMGSSVSRGRVLDDDALAMARAFLGPLLDYDASLAPRLDEIAETCVRFELSLFMHPSRRTSSPGKRRDYLRRTLVPALGL